MHKKTRDIERWLPGITEDEQGDQNEGKNGKPIMAGERRIK